MKLVGHCVTAGFDLPTAYADDKCRHADRKRQHISWLDLSDWVLLGRVYDKMQYRIWAKAHYLFPQLPRA